MMKLESCNKYGFEVFHITKDTTMLSDIEMLILEVENKIKSNIKKIAIAFEIRTYPYSKLISLLIKLNKLIESFNGTFVVVSPNKSFEDTLKETKLNTVFVVVPTEEKLSEF